MTDENIEYEVRRSGEDRRVEVCPHHEQRVKVAELTREAVAKHSGQWKILLWVLGGFAVLCLSGVSYIHITNQETAKQIENSTRRIELTFSNYMAAHIAESAEGFRRIGAIEHDLEDHELRIRSLEQEIP